jgi:hypothetical protein
MSRPVIIRIPGRRVERDAQRWEPSLKSNASRLRPPPLSRLRRRLLSIEARIAAARAVTSSLRAA